MSENRTTLELGIEFIAELLLFLFPYGAEQMGLPPNFWLGLVCWIAGAVIAVRMFWIFPLWSHRFTKLEKALISFIMVALFVAVFWRPVAKAYSKRNMEEAKEASPPIRQQESERKQSTPPEETPSIKPIPPAKPSKGSSVPKSNQLPSSPPPLFQNCPSGICNGGDNYGTQQLYNFAPVPRRVPVARNADLVTLLSEKKAKATLLANGNDAEAYQFAQDIFDILNSAGWEIKDNRIGIIGFWGGGPPPTGVRVGFHGEPTKPGEMVTITKPEAAWYVLRILQVSNVKTEVVPALDVPEDQVNVTVASRN